MWSSVPVNEQENNFSYVIDNIFEILAGFRLTHDLQTWKKDKAKYIYNTAKLSKGFSEIIFFKMHKM